MTDGKLHWVAVIDGRFGKALIATRRIEKETVLFGGNDWWDENERREFIELTPDEVQKLPPEERRMFLKFAYNHHPLKILGTLNPNAPRHPSNFFNHSCDPNTGYDLRDNVVTLRDVAAGEELTMDYGTFSFTFDQEFVCACGSPNCRGQVRRDDWKILATTCGLKFPTFMHSRIQALLVDAGQKT